MAVNGKRHNARVPGGTKAEGRTLFGTQTDVAFLGGTLIIEVGECWQAHRLIPRSKDFHALCGTIAHVDSRIEGEMARGGGVLLRHDAGREGPLLQHDVVLHEITHIGAAVVFGVKHAVFTRHGEMLGSVHRTSQVGAVNAFFAHLRSDGRTSQRPRGPGVDAGGVDIVAVEILASLGVMDELIMVNISQPRHLRNEMHASLRFGLGAQEIAPRGFPLVGIGTRIEGVGTEVLRRDAGLRFEFEGLIFVMSLPEGFDAAETSVFNGTIGTAVTDGGRSGEARTDLPSRASLGQQCPIAAALNGERQRTAAMTRHDIDGAREGLTAEDARSRALKDFYALNVVEV